MDKLRIEIIEWIDANSYSGWGTEKAYLENAKSSLRCRSVGMVFFENDDRISICLSRTEGDEQTSLNHSITIPKIAILSRKKLRYTS